MRANLLLFCAIFIVQTSLYAQDSATVVPKRIYTTKALSGEKPPVIDGIMDESGWNRVDWENDFIESRPDENTPPSNQTRFKITYDQKYIYIGIQCLDSLPDKIVKRLSRRDSFDGDWVGVFIDSYYDKRTAFGFIVSAAGVKGDVFETNNGGNEDDSWNPIWYTKTKIDAEGWTAEMKIPLSQ